MSSASSGVDSHQPTPLTSAAQTPRVFMLDLLATVPYYTAYLSRALLDRGVSVEVGSITYYLDRECFRSRGLTLRPGLLDLVGTFPRLPRVIRQSLKLVETVVNLAALSLRFTVRPPDILHVQYLPMLRLPLPLDAWLVRFARRRGAHLVLTVHDLLPHDTAERFRNLYRKLYNGMDALICHSTHVRDRLISEFSVPAERIEVIPHGPFFFDLPATDSTPIRQALGVEFAQRMVLWQGILFPYKGVDLLLEAWKQVEAALPEACLVVLGTGSPSITAAVTAQAQRLGLQRVHFEFRFCSTEELVAAYRTADVVVYPYRAITTSGALATGLALGKAIVASDLPVFRELLTDGVNALLVDATDPHRLAAALLHLLRDEGERQRFSANLRVLDFGHASWRQIALDTAALYRKLVRNDTSDIRTALP